MPKYKTLHAGDIRQKGDEVAKILEVDWRTHCPNTHPRTFVLDAYSPVRLLGHAILSSDLIVSSFRRPL